MNRQFKLLLYFQAGFRFFDFPDVMDKLSAGDDQCSLKLNRTKFKQAKLNRSRRDAEDWAGAGVMGALDMSRIFHEDGNNKSSTVSAHENYLFASCILLTSLLSNIMLTFVIG